MSDDYPAYGPLVKRPLKIRVLQAASVVLAVAGLILLYLYSVNREIPLVRVDSITPTMNFATVRIDGEVTRDAYLFESGGVVFNLNDGSGEIAVLGGRAQAEALKDSGRLPRRGDRVEVFGSLGVGAEQDVKLRMRSTEQLVLQRKPDKPSAPAAAVHLADITSSRAGERVLVSGTLQNINIPGPGSRAPYVLTLEQDGSTLDVVFWQEVFQGLDRQLPLPGTPIRVLGRVDVYKGNVQLKVQSAADLSEAGG